MKLVREVMFPWLSLISPSLGNRPPPTSLACVLNVVRWHPLIELLAKGTVAAVTA